MPVEWYWCVSFQGEMLNNIAKFFFIQMAMQVTQVAKVYSENVGT